MSQKEKEYLEDLKRRDARKAHLKNFVLILLQQCKDENLTMEELDSVISAIKDYAEKTTLRDGLTL